MKWYKLIVFLFVCLLSFTVEAKNNTILFDSKFNAIGSTSVEPYEVVTLRGEFDSSKVMSFKIILNNGMAPREVNAKITNNTWTAQVGPFLPKQPLSLKFEITEKLSDNDFNTFRDDFETAFNSSIDWVVANVLKSTSDSKEIYKAFAFHFKNDLPASFRDYTNKDGIPASQVLVDALEISQINNIFEVANKFYKTENRKKEINSIKKSIVDSFTDSTQRKTAQSELDKMLSSEKPIGLEAFPKQFILACDIKIIEGNESQKALLFNLKELAKAHNEVAEQKERIDTILNQFDILKTSELTTEMDTNVELTIDIHQYVGFDIVPMTFIGENRPGNPFGIFFTVSPYFGKISPDERIIEPEPEGETEPAACERSIKNFVRCVTPTIGLALPVTTDSLKIKPVVFAGLGIRINPLVRLNAGVSVYTPEKGAPPKACFTMGLGIRVDYVGEILKSFTTANTNF